MNLLMHICCGPCAVFPIKSLLEGQIQLQGYFYNPNIHPWDEFQRRKENVEKLSSLWAFGVFYDDEYQETRWESMKDPEARCKYCYSSRLASTAKIAKEKGFDAFSTTLLVSPYQKHEWIREFGEKFAKETGVAFYYNDFRPGFRTGQQLARELGLYRQKYCGCIVSLREAEAFRNHKKENKEKMT